MDRQNNYPILLFCSEQAPAVYRKIPVYRDLTQIPIPGFLKIKYRYFSVLLYSTQDNIFKDLYRFSSNFGDIWGLSEPLKSVLSVNSTDPDFTLHFSQDFL